MSFSNTNSLTDRLGDAAKARTATLMRFKARPAADDPAVLARRSARGAVIEAREVRLAERAATRHAEILRAEADLEIERLAAVERERLEAAAQAERAEARKIELKAQRDARYLARKAKVQRR